MPNITDIVRLLDRELWLVTSASGGRNGGLIATFISHASIVPEIPRMLVGIAKQHHTWQLIEASRAFTLHLLDESQLEWVWRFGLQTGHATDKFDGLPTIKGPLGCPRLPGVAAWLDCRVEASMETGDRTIYLAEVLDSHLEKGKQPLTMQRLLQIAPAERMRQLREGMARDAIVDAAAIAAWRQT